MKKTVASMVTRFCQGCLLQQMCHCDPGYDSFCTSVYLDYLRHGINVFTHKAHANPSNDHRSTINPHASPLLSELWCFHARIIDHWPLQSRVATVVQTNSKCNPYLHEKLIYLFRAFTKWIRFVISLTWRILLMW